MKKLLALLMAVVMVFCFASCGQAPEVDEPVVSPDTQAESDLAYIKDKGTLIVGITEYEPMNFKDDAGEWTGFDTEFALAVAEKLGVEVEFVEIDWDGKIMELDSKSIDCVWNGMTLTDEVKAGMSCTDPYVVNAQVLVMAKDKVADYTDVESLKDLKFAAESGSAGAAAIKDVVGVEATEVTTQADALMEVAAGSVDACVIDITMANAMTGEGTSYADLAAGLSLTSEFYGIGFRKGSDVTAEVNAIVDEMIADNSLKVLAEKYSLTLAE